MHNITSGGNLTATDFTITVPAHEFTNSTYQTVSAENFTVTYNGLAVFNGASTITASYNGVVGYDVGGTAISNKRVQAQLLIRLTPTPTTWYSFIDIRAYNDYGTYDTGDTLDSRDLTFPIHVDGDVKSQVLYSTSSAFIPGVSVYCYRPYAYSSDGTYDSDCYTVKVSEYTLSFTLYQYNS